MKKLLVATRNPGKFREICEAFEGSGIELLFLGDMVVEDGDFVEDGDTFEENARKKAVYYHEKTGLLSLGEDSGIIVNALAGELGVKTRRWGAGEGASDSEWLDFFMDRMRGEGDRSAEFVCAACIYGEGIDECFFGETRGEITQEPRAEIHKGIPLSSVFLPEGVVQVYAALSAEEKNKISHRGKAIGQVVRFLLGNS